ncbi:MAG: hypothetical protein IT489_05590 [Gammaproteobacteria bacterium]|nr:hypothetical protein [Gammaproteobacteria bacterium]
MTNRRGCSRAGRGLPREDRGGADRAQARRLRPAGAEHFDIALSSRHRRQGDAASGYFVV